MKFKLKEAGEKTAFLKTAAGDSKTIEFKDEKELTPMKDNPDIRSIETAAGKKIKEGTVKDSQGQDLNIGDVVNIDGKIFKILIGPDGTAWFGDTQNNLLKKIEPRHAPLFDMAVKVVEESYEPTSPEEPVLSVGHIDDEAGMLKQTAYDIVKYGADLYKMLMHYEAMNTHVDFPHWWQAKVIKARDYISAATHYLEYETKEPVIQQQIDNITETEDTVQK